jgi:hypothetical protein
MPKFYMYGDVRIAAEICVTAKNAEDAMGKALENAMMFGKFEVVNQDNKNKGFEWNGERPSRKPHGLD